MGRWRQPRERTSDPAATHADLCRRPASTVQPFGARNDLAGAASPGRVTPPHFTRGIRRACRPRHIPSRLLNHSLSVTCESFCSSNAAKRLVRQAFPLRPGLSCCGQLHNVAFEQYDSSNSALTKSALYQWRNEGKDGRCGPRPGHCGRTPQPAHRVPTRTCRWRRLDVRDPEPPRREAVRRWSG